MIEEISIDQVKRKLAECQVELERARNLMTELLVRTGDRSTCKSCGADIWFVLHPATQRRGVYNADGLSHYVTCNDPERWRKRNGRRKYPDTSSGIRETAD
jgi:hypothetical protein